MDGMTMLDLLRRTESGNVTKVIMLTNLEPNGKIISNSIKDQLTYYFVKSDTKLANLLKKIKNLLGE